MSAGVVVPLAVTDDWRQRAWDCVRDRLAGDGWPVLPGENVSDLWCKSLAVSAALHGRAMRPDDVLVVHDADVLIDLAALRAAVAAVESGAVEWAIPHTDVLRLTQRATARYYETGEVPAAPELTRWPYVGVEGGGAVVLTRRVYDACPLDAGFLGWGEEDICWGWALRCLHGEPWRAPQPLVHLWHPHAVGERVARSPRWESDTLRRRYMVAREDPDRMRRLVAGAR